MEDKSFVWTAERTQRFFQLRFENDWLFKKKRQPWKEFRKILMQNGFPEEMTVNHVRKKWSYTYDCYRLAKRTKNKKWLYYKMFDKHFRKNKALDRFDSWNDKWRLCLIQSISQSTNPKNQNIDWRLVEIEIRSKDLPVNCCIQDIKALWHHLKVTFHRKYRLNLKKGAELTDWPLYDTVLQYYETFLPNSLVRLQGEYDVNISEYTDGITESSELKYDIKLKHSPDEEFHWSRDITESFINLRLQHEWLFQEKKWAWNDFATIMKKEYGFPSYLTGRAISHKWSATYCSYQKAKATGNTNWLYYSLFETYLGATVVGFDLLKNWNEEWLQCFVRIKTELEPYFFEVERSYTAWREVEKKLRVEGLPIDHSLLELRAMWVQLMKQYKWKKKFAKKGILNEKWPYYDSMSKYMVVNEELFNNKKSMLNAADDVPFNGDDYDYEDEIMLFDLKKRLKDESIDVNSCRACGEVGGSVNLFDQTDDNGYSLANKMKTVGGVEVDIKDTYPKQICYECLRELEIAFNFRKKCVHVDNKLRSFKTHDIKIEVDIKRDDVYISDNIVDDQNDTFDAHEPGISDNEDLGFLTDGIGTNHNEKTIKQANRKPIKKVNVNNKVRKKYKYDYSKVCEICGKRSRNIKNHMDSHATEKCYECTQCGKKFKFQSGLAIHKALHDPVPKKTCEVCGKTFHIMAQYRKHFIYHANERKFSCETCGKAFHTKDILLVHMRMHTDERPFSCPECGKTFRTAGCVSRHRRIVHNNKKQPISKELIPLDRPVIETYHSADRQKLNPILAADKTME